MPQPPSHLFLLTRPSSLPHPPTFRTLAPFSLSFAPSLTHTRPGRHTHMLSSTSTHSRLSESSHQTLVSPLALSLFQSCSSLAKLSLFPLANLSQTATLYRNTRSFPSFVLFAACQPLALFRLTFPLVSSHASFLGYFLINLIGSSLGRSSVINRLSFLVAVSFSLLDTMVYSLTLIGEDEMGDGSSQARLSRLWGFANTGFSKGRREDHPR